MPADKQTSRDRPEAETGAPQIEVTPAMIEAGLEELLGFFPDSASYYDGRAVCAIFTAMCAARFLSAKEPQGPLFSAERL